MAAKEPRQGRPWRTLTAQLRANPRWHHCAHCGGWIDVRLHRDDPWSWTLDHIVPLARGGHPTSLDNVQAMHRSCNSSLGAKVRRSQPRHERRERREPPRPIRSRDW